MMNEKRQNTNKEKKSLLSAEEGCGGSRWKVFGLRSGLVSFSFFPFIGRRCR